MLLGCREELSELRERLEHAEGPAVMELEEEVSRLQVNLWRNVVAKDVVAVWRHQRTNFTALLLSCCCCCCCSCVLSIR